MNLMVTTRQKPIVDTQNIMRKESNHKGRKQERKKGIGTMKQLENNE